MSFQGTPIWICENSYREVASAPVAVADITPSSTTTHPFLIGSIMRISGRVVAWN